jgi:hypothetical protein
LTSEAEDKGDKAELTGMRVFDSIDTMELLSRTECVGVTTSVLEDVLSVRVSVSEVLDIVLCVEMLEGSFEADEVRVCVNDELLDRSRIILRE